MANKIIKKHGIKTKSPASVSVRLSSDSHFAYIEAYNHLRTNIMFSLAALDCDKKTIVVTSATPSDGKSSLSSNLAISLAKLNKKVLIIDADMRKPTIHKIFSQSNKCGLSNLLLGSSVENAIIAIGDYNLDFLPAGTIPPNPSELLSSKNTSILIKELEKYYDYIIIDTPPVLVVSDALMLSECAAGVLVACRAHKSKYGEVDAALNSLAHANFNILGTVLIGAKIFGEGHGNLGGYSSYSEN